MKFESSEVIIVTASEEWGFEVMAKWREGCLGKATCLFQSNQRILLADLLVKETAYIPWPTSLRFLNCLGMPRKLNDIRGHGIGTRIMEKVFSQAISLDAREIWGSIVQVDIGRCPTLLAWYERLGFAIVAPDDECLPDAVKKISKRLLAREDRR